MAEQIITCHKRSFRSSVHSPLWSEEHSHSHPCCLHMTERLHFHFSLSCIGEGNGNPLQCSCLENPRDGGAWWAAIYGVAQNQTRLKRLSSSSSIAQLIKNLPAMQETRVRSLGQEDPLEKGKATQSSILAWRIYGQRSLVGYSPWGCKESDTMHALCI